MPVKLGGSEDFEELFRLLRKWNKEVGEIMRPVFEQQKRFKQLINPAIMAIAERQKEQAETIRAAADSMMRAVRPITESAENLRKRINELMRMLRKPSGFKEDE